MSSEQKSSLPAGLELFFELEKANVTTPLQAFVLALHWAVMRAGLRIKKPSAAGSTTVETTEKLPEGWTAHVDQISTSPSSLDYVNQENTKETYQLKVIEVAPNDTVVITVYSPTAPASGAATNPRTSSAATFQIASYIRMTEGPAAAQTPQNIYYNANEMEKKIWSELLEPLGLRVMGQPPILGPYEDKTKRETTPNQSGSQSQDPYGGYIGDPYGGAPRPPLNPGGIGGPLFVPPVGGGGLGRSDLDPLGGIGAGMIADPRGFRNPRLGQPLGGGLPGVPPGARFDPFGPPNPGAGPRPPGPPGGPGGPNWGVPNPDHEQPPPGFEDMFM